MKMNNILIRISLALLGAAFALRADPPANPPASTVGKRGQMAEFLKNADVFQDLTYATIEGQPIRLDLFVPKNPLKPLPLVVWIHGGGLIQGDKKGGRHNVLPLLPLNYAVASIDYRLAPAAKWPAQLDDCKAAIRWLRAHAADYGYDPNLIAVGGDSSGGHLASLLGTTADRPQMEGNEGPPHVSSAVSVVCDFFGPSDLVELARQKPVKAARHAEMVFGVSDAADLLKKERAASPVTYIDAHTCPFYIAQGDMDKSVPMQQSVELDNALKKAGVPEVLHIVQGGGHEFHDQAATQGMIDFLDKYLKPGPSAPAVQSSAASGQ